MTSPLSDSRAGEPVIRRWSEIGPRTADILDAIDTIFFEASATRSFDSAIERATFRDRWLGRYVEHDPQWLYVAFSSAGDVAGYLAGCLADPARAPRFADVGYFHELAELTAEYPAHLHINLAARYRSRGWGGLLVESFARDARDAGAPGMHVVTGRGVRNVRFYAASGFREARAFRWNDRELVFLARDLCRSAPLGNHDGE